MSPSNLGIVFGPTLMKPKPTGATVSLSSLVDYPHQARIVEALIVFHKQIFDQGSGGLRPPCSASYSHSQAQVSTGRTRTDSLYPSIAQSRKKLASWTWKELVMPFWRHC